MILSQQESLHDMQAVLMLLCSEDLIEQTNLESSEQVNAYNVIWYLQWPHCIEDALPASLSDPSYLPRFLPGLLIG